MTTAAQHTPWKMIGLLLVVCVGQIGFSWQMKDTKPALGYVPTPPSEEFITGLAMGDEQFLFRLTALMLQNSGDTFGRFSPLKLYNYKDLARWFTLEDILDSRSDYMPSMAAYYFSQTQNVSDVRYLANYLYEHARHNAKDKWWWLMQAIYLANHKLKDQDLALKIAQPLRNSELPVMAQQLLAIVYEQRGEMDQAFEMLSEIQKNVENIPEKDLRYMHYFAEERLKRLEEFQEQAEALGRPLPDFEASPNVQGGS